METQELIKMLAEGSVDTLYMTLVSTDRDKKGWLKTNVGGESDFGYFCKYFKIYSIFDLVDRSDPSDKTDCRKKLWLYRYDCPARYCSGTIYCAYDRVFFVGSRTRCCGGCVKYGSFPA